MMRRYFLIKLIFLIVVRHGIVECHSPSAMRNRRHLAVDAQTMSTSSLDTIASQNGNELLLLTKEILMGEIFRDSIKDVSWLASKNFSPSGSAANYSLLYILFRVLEDFNPTSIIEFGMGQTSKLTSQYAANKNIQSNLFIVEHDQTWIDIFKQQIPMKSNITILKLPLQYITYKGCTTTVYGDLIKSVGPIKFDLIINDGPHGTIKYSRIGVLDLIPDYLKESFVIIIDDYDRNGEKDTVQEIMAKLTSCKINYGHTIYKGTKEQFVIYSKNLSFLKSL